MNYEITPSEVLIGFSRSELEELLRQMREGSKGKRMSPLYSELVGAWCELTSLQDKVLKEAL